MEEIAVNAEVNFHEQEVVSIFHETNTSGRDQLFAELAFSAAFAIRSMSNLGNCEVTDALGFQLVALAHLLVGPTELVLQPVPRLVPYPGTPGRYRFICQFRLTPGQVRLDFSAKGFGWFYTGVGYYGPASVQTMFRYFASRRPGDDGYLAALAKTAATCGELQTARQIHLTNHPQLLMLVMGTCFAEFIPA